MERERGEFTVYNIILSPVTVVSGWEDQTTLPYQARPSPAMCFQQRDFFIHRADYKAMLDDFNPSLFDVGAATTPAFPGFCFSNFLSPTPPFSFFFSSSELPRLGPLSHGVEISKTVILLACHFYRDSGLAGDLEIGVIIRGKRPQSG